MPTVGIVDHFDSFVSTLGYYVQDCGARSFAVRSDSAPGDVLEDMRPDAIVLGPGPGHPADSGYVDLIHRFAGRIPMLGVCLGHQALGLAFGARVVHAQAPLHGKTSEITHDRSWVFHGAPAAFSATRYHSMTVDAASVRTPLRVAATSTEDANVMAMRHESLPLASFQFHPESIGTGTGLHLVRTFLDAIGGRSS